MKPKNLKLERGASSRSSLSENSRSDAQARLKNSLWGVAPLAPIHLGFDSLVVHQRELAARGYNHILLVADIHAMMSHGLTWNDVNIRRIYYEYYFKEVCGIKSTCIYGSSFQTRAGYSEDLYFLLSQLPFAAVRDSKQAGEEAPMSAWVIYAVMQCLDVGHVAPHVDLIVAEPGQKRIYNLLKAMKSISTPQSNKQLLTSNFTLSPQFEYVEYSHDILGKPLSESTTHTRISVHDTPITLRRKIQRMNAPEKQKTSGDRINALLEHFKNSVFPWNPQVKITGSGKEREFTSYAAFEADYLNGLVHPSDAREALFHYLETRLRKIQQAFGKGITHWIDFNRLELPHDY